MLTKKQYNLLIFIEQYQRVHGISPSYDEMKNALNLASKSGIYRLVTSLEKRRFLRRLPHCARALEVLKLPENLNSTSLPPSPDKVRKKFIPNIITPKFTLPGAEPARPDDETVRLPLYGSIAAGTPIEALRDLSTLIEIPASLLADTYTRHYALKVDGDSMIDAGILDGDIVIVKQCDDANTGDIVVSLIEREEVTLKRLRKKGQSIALEPANVRYKTRIYGPDQVQVQGKLVGLVRKY